MPFYKVEIRGQFSTTLLVEAADEDSACEKAREDFDPKDGDTDHYDYEADANIVEGAYLERLKLRTAVYQGVNTLCARCGQPIQGDAVPSAQDRMLFYYCGEACRDAD